LPAQTKLDSRVTEAAVENLFLDSLEEHIMFKHILIPTDGSRLSREAVTKGLELAKEQGATVTVVTVSDPYHVFTVDPFMIADTEEIYTADCEKRASQRFEPVRKLALELGLELRTRHVYAAQPYEAIIDIAAKDECDLVCMASHGRKGVSALVLGSETMKVLTHSRIPVVVLR
jgi:nucleotide-binding universal stress UspA family protein